MNVNARTSTMIGLAAIALLFAAEQARAQVPDTIPVQGVLTDDSGTPVEGDQTVTFTLYDAGTAGVMLWSEAQTVTTDRGLFTAYLGSATALDMTIFDGRDLWLGITVGSDAEMTPRLAIASVPYAAFAAECASLPTGAVMFFDAPACPTGWSEFASLQGRVPVGIGAGGTLGATHGSALADAGARAITQVPAHTHQIDPPQVNSSYSGSLTINGSTTSTGAHCHPVDISNGGWSTSYLQGSSSNGAPVLNSCNAFDGNSGGHNHDVQVSGGSHRHSVNIGEFTSAPAGVGSVDVTMPYVQLLACRKD